MAIKYLAICIPLFLAACVAAAPKDTSIPPAKNDSCHAAHHKNTIGQHVSILEQSGVLQPVRIIRPNMPVTRDYIPDRINFGLNDKDVIRTISCG